MKNKVLVLGASGSFGSHCLRAFEAAGWEAHAFKRGQADMKQAAKGMDVIVNGMNPPNYKNWTEALPQIAKEVAAAALASGATLIQAGNVYNYGAQAGVWDENTPHAATTKKGKARIAMERILRDSGAQVIILRGGDFLDDRPSGNFIDFLTTKLAKGQLIYPGRGDAQHAWAYLPDMARAAVGLAEMRGRLSNFEDVPFGGHSFTGDELRAALERLTGHEVKIKKFPWLLLKLLSPFWPMARELPEMRYLWEVSHRLDNRRLSELLPGFRGTEFQTMLGEVVGQG